MRHSIDGPTPQPILFASFLGDNAFEFYREVVAYLAEKSGLPAAMGADLSPDEQERQVNAGAIQAVFTCGLPYVRKADLVSPLLRLVAAPVMAEARYQNRPLYFSDIIVKADSPYRFLADLQGTAFAYNEGHSLSGWVLPCAHFQKLGIDRVFFGDIVRSGSHVASMDWVESGRATAAAIDSIVLAMELVQRPERVGAFRVIATIGPLPAPPLAATPGLSEAHLQQIRQVLLEMHTTPAGQAILARVGVRRFAGVTDADYDPIREIIQNLTATKPPPTERCVE